MSMLFLGCSVKVAEINHRREEHKRSMLEVPQRPKKRSAAMRFMSALNPFQACGEDQDGAEVLGKARRAKVPLPRPRRWRRLVEPPEPLLFVAPAGPLSPDHLQADGWCCSPISLQRRSSLQDCTNLHHGGHGPPRSPVLDGRLGLEPRTTEDLDSLEALERESADTLTDLHQSGLGGGSFPGGGGSFLTPRSDGGGGFYSAASSPSLGPAAGGSIGGGRQGPFRASLAYDQQMKRGSRSDFPRCANCGKEAQRCIEDLTQPMQPFRGVSPGVQRGEQKVGSSPNQLRDEGVVFCDGECMWTYTLGQGSSTSRQPAKADPSHPAG